MALIDTLNRRHRAGLCATLVCVGLILLLGGGVRPAVGIGLLGIAFSWALGSDKTAYAPHHCGACQGHTVLTVPFKRVLLVQCTGSPKG